MKIFNISQGFGLEGGKLAATGWYNTKCHSSHWSRGCRMGHWFVEEPPRHIRPAMLPLCMLFFIFVHSLSGV